MFNFFNGNKKITEKLYEQNLELAVKNKTLSLLEDLYQTSVLTLTPEEMAMKITDIIRRDLNLELVGVLIFQKEADLLAPLAFSESERIKKTLDNLGFNLSNISITNISNREFFKKVLYDREYNTTNNLQEVWQELINQEHLKEIKKQSHIKTILLYPLTKGDGALGALILGFNRDYSTLNTFERASIKSFINVIALLLDKAYLYKDLQDSYEVTKRAYAIEKSAKEELKKLDEIKNQFLAQTQHDLRTPLGIIRDYCDLLFNGAYGKQPKKSLDVIKKIQTVAQNKLKDVNNFLDTAQFQLGKKVVSLKSGIELNPILDEIIDELKHGAESKGIYLKFEKPIPFAEGSVAAKEKVFTVGADREKLKSALFNVIDNSIKYTPRGGVVIKIKYQKSNIKNGENDNIIIEVQDTGIGIPREKIKTLFDIVFERSNEAKKMSPTGRGMGLYLSSQIIKAHNGKIWVESEGEGKGSVFHIELPIG